MNIQVRRIDTSKSTKCLCLTHTVSSIIGRIGVVISRYPLYFVIVPIIVSSLLSIGIIKILTNDDNECLLGADRGNVFHAKQFIEKTFPMNSGSFDFLRLTKRPLFPMIYIVYNRESNILRKEFLEEIQIVDKVAKNTTAFVDGKIIGYSDVCQIVDGKCLENTLINLLNDSENAIHELLNMKYPVNMDPLTYAYKILCLNLGGVKTDDKGYIIEAKAIRLYYVLDESNASKKKWNEEWTKAVYNKLRDYTFQHIKTFPDPFASTDYQVKRISQELVFLISVAVVVVAIFSISTNMTNNWVKSKPWLGVASVISAGLAVATAFGLLSACGVENLRWNVCLPFIILATEVDDSFVVLACWKVTDCNGSVENRMEQTYRNAAVSITITSLTNFFSYCIAMTSPFPGVRIFCLYAATCIFFSYFFQLFFFGGCLALSGYREEKGLHPFTFKPAFGTEMNNIEDLNKFKDRNRKVQETLRETLPHELSNPDRNAIQDNSTNFICLTDSSEGFRIIVGLVTIVGITTSLFVHIFRCLKLRNTETCQESIYKVKIESTRIGIWGVMSLQEGLNVYKFNSESSEITQGFHVFYKYFTQYPFTVHVVINETLDYSNPQVQESVNALMQKFHTIENIAGYEYEFSWLKYYKITQLTHTERGDDELLDGQLRVIIDCRVGLVELPDTCSKTFYR
ncbi:patched domain-containing protein 3-like [Centruroides sculpturatus]|uniref:patched domain-containing protein 3-like n=1 Tax=Centruroides sculpturatus TaxID=218467 RepID=UPI000C6CA0D3|nr:patched domain-containing protein 3-like [Centruroides sculpturatus]